MPIGNFEATIFTKEFVSVNLFWRFICKFFYMRFKEDKTLKIKPKKHYCLLFWAKHPHFYKEVWF